MSAESVLRAWGLHWRARLEGCPKERLAPDRAVLELAEGDALKHIEAMKVLHPRLTYEEAVEATKYGPVPRSHPLSYELPSIAQIERQVSVACLAVGSSLWERYKSESGWSPQPPPKFRTRLRVEIDRDGQWWGIEEPHPDVLLPRSEFQGRVFANVGVRYLVRQVYVCGCGTRSKWPGSSFDWLYPYASDPDHRNGNGRESTVRMVRSEIDGEPEQKNFCGVPHEFCT